LHELELPWIEPSEGLSLSIYEKELYFVGIMTFEGGTVTFDDKGGVYVALGQVDGQIIRHLRHLFPFSTMWVRRWVPHAKVEDIGAPVSKSRGYSQVYNLVVAAYTDKYPKRLLTFYELIARHGVRTTDFLVKIQRIKVILNNRGYIFCRIGIAAGAANGAVLLGPVIAQLGSMVLLLKYQAVTSMVLAAGTKKSRNVSIAILRLRFPSQNSAKHIAHNKFTQVMYLCIDQNDGSQLPYPKIVPRALLTHLCKHVNDPHNVLGWSATPLSELPYFDWPPRKPPNKPQSKKV
jgi:hypothetical protein